jgi:hypothetical protein
MIQEDILKIINQSQEVPKWVIKAREEHKELEALVNGVNFTDLLIKIEGKEDDEKAKVRRKYSRSIKDLFVRLLNPVDNIYSATGGTKVYDKSVDKKLIKKISQVRDGKTLEKWLQINWKPKLFTDPNGVIIYEWTSKDFYPTYKNINCIRNYDYDGQALKWILYEPIDKNGVKTWRFVDEEMDYTLQQQGEHIVFIDELSFKNPFRKCPGVIISDMIVIGDKKRITPIDSITEVAKEYLRDQSIKTLYKFLHGFPLFWRYVTECRSCKGLGKVGDKTCPDCNGVGFYMKKDVTDCITLPVPNSNDDVKVAPDIAGYISPELATWNQYITELNLLFQYMNETVWGVHIQQEVQKTATEVFSNYQPMITQLNVIADAAEWVDWYLTELAVNFIDQNKRADESKVILLYGRNYIIEPISLLLERYHTSKEKGDTSAILDKQLYEWVVSKYKSDPETLEQELKRIKVEPYIHNTVDEVEKIFGKAEAQKKVLFTKFWLSSDTKKPADVLKSEFDVWVTKQPEYVEYKEEKEGDESEVDEPTNIQQAALNGAQVTSMVEIVTAVTLGTMPKETGRALISAAFPSLTDEEINNIISPLK